MIFSLITRTFRIFVFQEKNLPGLPVIGSEEMNVGSMAEGYNLSTTGGRCGGKDQNREMLMCDAIV
jgi:hypothetical protein